MSRPGIGPDISSCFFTDRFSRHAEVLAVVAAEFRAEVTDSVLINQYTLPLRTPNQGYDTGGGSPVFTTEDRPLARVDLYLAHKRTKTWFVRVA